MNFIKKMSFLGISICAITGSSLIAQNISEPTLAELSASVNPKTRKIEIYANFDTDGKLFTGNSLITFVLDSKVEDIPLLINSESGMNWSDQSQTYNEDGKDYHAIITTGSSNIEYNSKEAIKLFDLNLPAGATIEDIRFWDLGKDKKVTNDGTDYLSNFYFPHKGYYLMPTVKHNLSTPTEEENATNFKAQIFPNPCITTTMLKFEPLTTGNYSIKIYDMTGRIVKESKLEVNANNKTEMLINIGTWDTGTYQCTIQDDKKNTLKTLNFVKIN